MPKLITYHICENCNKGFIPKRKTTAKFCSSKCAIYAQRTWDRGGETPYEKITNEIEQLKTNKNQKTMYPHELLMKENGLQYEELPAKVKHSIEDFNKIKEKVKEYENEIPEYLRDKLERADEMIVYFINDYLENLVESEQNVEENKTTGNAIIDELFCY